MTRQKPSKKVEEIDLSSVKTLIKSPTALAKHVNLTVNAIYRWIKVNRIPGEHILKVANFYNVELIDLMELTGSELSMAPNTILKPRDTLPTVIKVQDGVITMEDAAALLGVPLISVKLIMTHWGDQLKHLYSTLQQLELGAISLDQAALALGLAKYTLHGIRRKYGFAPGALKRVRPLPTLPKRKEKSRAAALRVIAGHLSAVDAAKEIGVTERTIFRKIEELTTHKLSDLSHWPKSFRDALVDEIDKGLPSFAEKWLDIAHKDKLFVRKTTKYPTTPATWRGEDVRRLMVALFTGEASLTELAESRRAEPSILQGLFDSQLVPYGVSVADVLGLPLSHQFAMADLLIWTMDRKRKVV